MIEFAPFLEKEMIYAVDIPHSRGEEDVTDLLESSTGRIYVSQNFLKGGATVCFGWR